MFISSPPVTAANLPTGIDATKLADGSVTNTEFQYLDATSSIQTQLDAKMPLAAGPTIAALTSKSTPVTNDDFLISDSAASDVAKRVTYGDLLTTLQAAMGGGGLESCALYKDASQTGIGNDAWADVTWPAEVWDPDGWHSTSSNTERIVVPDTGVYLFLAVLCRLVTSNNNYGWRWAVNGTKRDSAGRGCGYISIGDSSEAMLGLFSLTAADYVTLQLGSDGGTIDINYSVTDTFAAAVTAGVSVILAVKLA